MINLKAAKQIGVTIPQSVLYRTDRVIKVDAGPTEFSETSQIRLCFMTFTIRRTEPSDYEAVRQVYAGPKAIWGTLQLPFSSLEQWRKRLAEPPEGLVSLVACVEQEVVGQLSLQTFPNRPRRRHVGQIGMAVRDDWQGKGVGTALMQAAVDLADKWLNLTRLELEVYTDNKPAIQLYKKFGFTIEGTLVQFSFRDGQYVDSHLMARLRK